MGRIVLFGATGYTGDLTARALVDRGARPLLAARTESRVRALAEELGGLDWAVADVGRPETVRALVERGDVLVSTVGPFSHWGRPALQAAVDGGAHYLDSTGETPFIREVFEVWGPRAEAAGVGLLTAMGYDWVPGNLAGALALRDGGAYAVKVAIGYFASGTMGSDAMSGGTRASAAGVFLEPSFAWRDGRLVTERGAKRVRAFTVGGKARQAISAGSSEHFALPRTSAALREVDVYLGWFGPMSNPLRAFSAASSVALKVPGVKPGVGALLARTLKGSTGGPDAQARSRSGSIVVAEAQDAHGAVLAEVRLEGVNGYDFTAGMLAWGAETALAGGLQGTGALGPVDGFGLDALEAGAREAGISRAA
ncbi:MAG: saccharopine dehydrogenase NADP-binding domain-containing protein [Solirubrobacterales bacterium]|nr:saccharopine dehydrogenase NADP-binding domain-containing protein [Solirubrobacterales bacterium]